MIYLYFHLRNYNQMKKCHYQIIIVLYEFVVAFTLFFVALFSTYLFACLGAESWCDNWRLSCLELILTNHCINNNYVYFTTHFLFPCIFPQLQSKTNQEILDKKGRQHLVRSGFITLEIKSGETPSQWVQYLLSFGYHANMHLAGSQ